MTVSIITHEWGSCPIAFPIKEMLCLTVLQYSWCSQCLINIFILLGKAFLMVWAETCYLGNQIQLSVWPDKVINYCQREKCFQRTCTWIISLRIKCDWIQDLISDLNQLVAELPDLAILSQISWWLMFFCELSASRIK